MIPAQGMGQVVVAQGMPSGYYYNPHGAPMVMAQATPGK